MKTFNLLKNTITVCFLFFKFSNFYFKVAIFLLSTILISSKSFAGKGAFITCTNLTPFSVSFSLVNNSVNNMASIPSSINVILNPYNGIWPNSNTSQYVEASDFPGTSTFVFNTVSQNVPNPSASIQINEDNSAYFTSNLTSNGLQFIPVITPGDQYTINLYIMLPSNRWMTLDPKIQRNTLQNICIPGAHDAGMYNSTACTAGATSCNTQTQVNSFYNMLNLGVRYFDCRPVIAPPVTSYGTPILNTNICLGHFTYANEVLGNQGCISYSLASVLADVQKFASEMPAIANNEVIILKFSHFMDMLKYNSSNSIFDSTDLGNLQQIITSTLGNYLLKNNSGFLTTPIGQLTQGGIKIIVTFDDSEFGIANGINFSCNPSLGIYPQSILNLYDNYSGTESVQNMMSGQLDSLNLTKYAPPATYFNLSWTLTQTKEDAIASASCLGLLSPSTIPTILYLADQANAQLGAIPLWCKSTGKYPNILYTDGINNSPIISPALTLQVYYQPITISTILNNQNTSIK